MSTIARPSLGAQRLSSFATASPPIGNTEPATKLGVTLLAIYVFLITGRALDVSPIWFLHIPMIMLILLIVMTLSAGDFKHSMSSSITTYFAAFTAWVVVCFPFSSWRAGSIPSVQWQLQSLIIFIIVVQMVRSVGDWQKIAGGYAYAVLTAALLSFKIGVNVQGRVALPGGTLGDPNEFAMTLVVGLPFWWFKASRATGLKKVAFLLATLPVYGALARTGSRSGMVAMAVLFAVAFIFAKANQKIVILIGTLIALSASSVLLPDYLKARYMTFFSRDSGYDKATNGRLGADIASSENRKALLLQSLEMTFKHPILGVGPGDFSFVSWDERKATTGVGGESLVSHNTYTQISSETGLPGFFLFAASVVLSALYTYRTYKQAAASQDAALELCARYLLYACGALFSGIFFLSVGYTHILANLFALAAALRLISNNRSNVNVASRANGRSFSAKNSANTWPALNPSPQVRPQRPRPRPFRHGLVKNNNLVRRPSS